jgi:hypothetical protein
MESPGRHNRYLPTHYQFVNMLFLLQLSIPSIPAKKSTIVVIDSTNPGVSIYNIDSSLTQLLQ